MTAAESTPDRGGFTRRVLIVLGLTTAFAALALLLWAAVDVFLVVFAGVLLAVFLRGLADLLHHYTGLPRSWSLAVVGLALAALLGLGGWFLASQVAQQFDEFGHSLRAAWGQAQQYLHQYEWGRQALTVTSLDQWMPGRGNLLGRVSGVFSTALGALANLLVILFIGIYLAVDPGLYRRGVLHLVPLRGRPRAAEVLDAVGYTLRWWLAARLLTMTVVGILTAAGLWLLNIPLVLPLSLLAFGLSFVPYFGPILSAVPAVLIGMTAEGGPINGLYVALLYLGVQTVESYLIQPLVQRRAVSMPPALLISVQVLLGVLLGTMGVILASPLAAAGLVLVKMLYVEDTLGDPTVPVKAESQDGNGQARTVGHHAVSREGAS